MRNIIQKKKGAIGTEKWKYITSSSKEAAICKYCNVIHEEMKEPYNLESDPKETRNIISE